MILGPYSIKRLDRVPKLYEDCMCNPLDTLSANGIYIIIALTNRYVISTWLLLLRNGEESTCRMDSYHGRSKATQLPNSTDLYHWTSIRYSKHLSALDPMNCD